MYLSLAALLLNIAGCSARQQPAVSAVPEGLYGTYYEEIAGRGHFTLDENGIDCLWSSSAAETTEYTMEVVYDEANNRLTYQNGVRRDIVFDSENKSTATVVYEDGTGYFEIDGDKLIWHNDKEEGGPSKFIKDTGADH